MVRRLAAASFLLAACGGSSVSPGEAGESCSMSLADVVTVPSPVPEEAFRALVFTRTAGYRHGSIPAGVRAVQALGAATGFGVDTTSDPGRFTATSLAPYRVVIFLNTTGDVLDGSQQAALEAFVAGGGGWAGVHSAADTEYEWPWYRRMVGAHFASHPAIQQATVLVADPSHPSTTALPSPWVRTDEWYNFDAVPGAAATVLLRLDESSYSGGTMGTDHPIAWSRADLGGRVWYTGLGHTSCSYVERPMLAHLRGGIVWAAAAESLATRPF